MNSCATHLKQHLSGKSYPVIGIPDYIAYIKQDQVSFPKPSQPKPIEKPVLLLPPPPQPPVQGKISSFLGLDAIHKARMADYRLALFDYHNSFSYERNMHKKAMEIYGNNLERRSKELLIYENTHKLHKLLEEFLPISLNDLYSRAQMIEMYLSIVPRPMIMTDPPYHKKRDLCEPYFKNLLDKEYGEENVFDFHSIGTYDYSSFRSTLTIADFVLQIPNTSLVFVIEIDEPYSSQHFSPTDYIEETSQEDNDYWPTFTDVDRDNSFMKCGWAVIRFTEKQVVKNSKVCINLINNFADFLLQKSDWNNLYACIENIGAQKRWTKSEASKMMYNEFRESYLPHDLKKILLDRKSDYNRSRNDELPF
jgi:hypothetical protein